MSYHKVKQKKRGPDRHNELRRRPELQPVVDVEGDRLIALGSIQDDTWHYPVRRIHVYGDRRGAMTARVPDAAVALDPFADPEGAETELAAIGRLLGVLQRGATGEGVQAVLDGAPPGVEQLWRELVKGGLLRAG